MPNEYCSSTRSEASGTTIRSSVQTESKSSSSARLVRSSSSLTVTMSRKFGKYSASFMGQPPHGMFAAWHGQRRGQLARLPRPRTHGPGTAEDNKAPDGGPADKNIRHPRQGWQPPGRGRASP